MIVPRPKDAKHKYQMFRLLRGILTDTYLANQLYFKGGSCAALRGFLDRFSVDLDFDILDKESKNKIREKCQQLVRKLGFEIKDQSQRHLQFFLKYQSVLGERNTLKLEINDEVNKYNRYEKVNLSEINMYCNAQTIDTMFANKLVAAKARFEKNGQIAGRDFYDLHQFFLQGLPINRAVVEEKMGMRYEQYLQELIVFIKNQVDKVVLNQDLNPLLPTLKLNAVVKDIKEELLVFLEDEIRREKE